MTRSMDLNADVGERPEALRDGREEKLLGLVSSANIACGGHAGDDESMKSVMRLCEKHGVGIGAHPSYPDRENFGRKAWDLGPEDITAFVYVQIGHFVRLADELKLPVRHIKPHGALYNEAAGNARVAKAIADGIGKIGRDFVLFGLSGSVMLDVWREEGFATASEAFADRLYESNGSLRSRRHADALIANPEAAADQALLIAETGFVVASDGVKLKVKADTICIHGDTEEALAIAGLIRSKLGRSGIAISNRSG